MSKKQLDTSALVNELSGNSVFFQRKPPALPQDRHEEFSNSEMTQHPKDDQAAERPLGRMTERPDGRTTEWPNGRNSIRHGFDIFDDQLQALKDIQRSRERQHKKKVTLGRLAQEAFEKFIQCELKKLHR